MTHAQLKARMRRMREKHEEEIEEGEITAELNLVPYLDIITNIIIFLLASVAMNVVLGNVNVTQPTYAIGGAAGGEDQPDKPPLNLTVSLTQNGFIIAASGGQLPGPDGQLPTIRNRDGRHDFGALSGKLREIKGEFAEETKVIFMADAEMPYDLVIKSLDAMREDAKGILFPDVTFSGGVM